MKHVNRFIYFLYYTIICVIYNTCNAFNANAYYEYRSHGRLKHKTDEGNDVAY